MINDDNQDTKENTGRRVIKKNWIKNNSLSEFLIKIQSIDGVIDGGEVFCTWTDKSQKINDINDVIKYIEEQCDSVGYPQAQRKSRDWNS